MPSIFELYGYKIYFWSNENNEPIHVHVSKGQPTANSTKIWITKNGGCVISNNNSQISMKDLNNIMKTISSNYFYVVAKWKETFRIDEVKFYC